MIRVLLKRKQSLLKRNDIIPPFFSHETYNIDVEEDEKRWSSFFKLSLVSRSE